MVAFTLYTRSYCHLCEDMLRDLLCLLGEEPHELSVIDVDSDPALLALYDEYVPVLWAKKMIDGKMIEQKLCHYFLDKKRVQAFCDE